MALKAFSEDDDGDAALAQALLADDLLTDPQATLHDDLQRRVGKPFQLTLTDNRRRLVSVSRKRDGLNVRLHRGLLAAPVAVREALARFILHGEPVAGRAVRDFLHAHAVADIAAPRVSRQPKLRPLGAVYDLTRLLDQAVFQLPEAAPRMLPGITWGQRRRPGRSRVRLGSYDPAHQLIRINPLLDHPDVPVYMVRFVVFHELVHHLLETGEGPVPRRHGREFRALEQQSPDHVAAAAWQQRWLPTHLRALLSG